MTFLLNLILFFGMVDLSKTLFVTLGRRDSLYKTKASLFLYGERIKMENFQDSVVLEKVETSLGVNGDFYSVLRGLKFEDIILNSVSGIYPQKKFLEILRLDENGYDEEISIVLWIYYEFSRYLKEPLKVQVSYRPDDVSSNKVTVSGNIVGMDESKLLFEGDMGCTIDIPFNSIVSSQPVASFVNKETTDNIKKYHKYFFTIEGFIEFFIGEEVTPHKRRTVKYVSKSSSGVMEKCYLSENMLNFSEVIYEHSSGIQRIQNRYGLELDNVLYLRSLRHKVEGEDVFLDEVILKNKMKRFWKMGIGAPRFLETQMM